MPVTKIAQFDDAPVRWLSDGVDYVGDFIQRSVLFSDILRRRGNQFLDHLRRGQPPVLRFDYDILLDGRKIAPPTNFYLAAIRDRRNPSELRFPEAGDQRQAMAGDPCHRMSKRPVIIIDPRAGHGPGIGGSKRDSEIGMALDQGYPVYVILFTTWPEPGQTLEHVQTALARFVGLVRDRHPQAGNPAIIGNCQAGWAAALLCAQRPDITATLVMNGAPLSYWAGVNGKHPLRYKGGLTGGVWQATWWGDLGNGTFDGAHLVASFEDLNPAQTYWDKQYHLWANIDTEAERYLDFERWWNGYFMLTSDEIHFIVDQLFIGNRAQQGLLVVNRQGVDLKAINGPIVVFASQGDNITPPQQALNWIPAVWGSVDEIRRRHQVIVYLVHGSIGHLGIFVSGAVSRREHREILTCFELMDYLSPGLYEMVISDDDGPRQVRFQARDMDDILALDDACDDQGPFGRVAALSRLNDNLYRWLVRPWVRGIVTETTAETLRQLHPLRISRYGFSDLNPWIAPVSHLAAAVKDQRRPVSADNFLLAIEKAFCGTITQSLNFYRDCRDRAIEFWFYAIFDNPWLRAISAAGSMGEPTNRTDCRADWLDEIDRGGFAEGVLRIMIALAHAGDGTRRRSLAAYDELAGQDSRLADLRGPALAALIKKQSCIMLSDPQAALGALPQLIPLTADQRRALAIASRLLVNMADADPQVVRMRDTIATIFDQQPAGNDHAQ